MDRDQLASLLQALAVEPAVPRKTARVVRCVTMSLARNFDPHAVYAQLASHAGVGRRAGAAGASPLHVAAFIPFLTRRCCQMVRQGAVQALEHIAQAPQLLPGMRFKVPTLAW